MSAVFFLTFLTVWRRQPQRTYTFAWAITFLFASISWGIDFTRLFIGDAWVAFATNIAFPLVALFTVRGVCLRYRAEAPDRFLFSLCGASVVTSSYLGLAQENPILRGMPISLCMAVMLVIGLSAILRTSRRDHIDYGIACALGFVAFLLVMRPVVSIVVEGSPSADGGMANSFWIVSAKLVAIFSWFSFGILFLVRIALDLIQDLAEQSVTDALSGVLNRRGFFEQAGPALDQASAVLPVAILICDIDRFKRINDTFGHSAGDRVIQGFAKVLREGLGEFGIVGRLGGEEFALVLPKTNSRAALLFAEGIRTAFSHAHHEGIALSRQPTVSIGFAESRGGETLDAVLERADAALYRAKRNGRNRVECSGSNQSDPATNAA